MNKVKITDIKMTKKGRYSIFTDGEYAISIDDETLIKSKIKIGDFIDYDKFIVIHKNSEYKKCLNKGYDILSYRPHSIKEIKEKLLKFYDEETILKAIEKLLDLKLLNDEDFCKMYLDSLIRKGKSSKSTIEYELRKKGIDIYIIEDCLSSIVIDDSERVKNLVLKKYKTKILNGEIDKVRNALLRNGYNWQNVKDGINIAIEEINKENDI
ncbi:MAG: RecX family transcriptional regulator [Oscillospiraceae bacterium]